VGHHDGVDDVRAEHDVHRHGPVGSLPLLLAEKGQRADIVGAALAHDAHGGAEDLRPVEGKELARMPGHEVDVSSLLDPAPARDLHGRRAMPNSRTKKKAQQDLAEGKSASTAAGEFVREEMHHIRDGKHGARSTEQAIAIGLSEARRAGVSVKPSASAREATKTKAAQESRRVGKAVSAKRSRATTRALQKEPHAAASRRALSRHGKTSAAKRREEGGSSR
jgi:hypothetical protein